MLLHSLASQAGKFGPAWLPLEVKLIEDDSHFELKGTALPEMVAQLEDDGLVFRKSRLFAPTRLRWPALEDVMAEESDDDDISSNGRWEGIPWTTPMQQNSAVCGVSYHVLYITWQ